MWWTASASSPRAERSAAASASNLPFQAGSWGTTLTGRGFTGSSRSSGPALPAAVQGVYEDGEQDYHALHELDPGCRPPRRRLLPAPAPKPEPPEPTNLSQRLLPY